MCRKFYINTNGVRTVFIFSVPFQNLLRFVFEGASNSLQFRTRRQCCCPSPEQFQFFTYKLSIISFRTGTKFGQIQLPTDTETTLWQLSFLQTLYVSVLLVVHTHITKSVVWTITITVSYGPVQQLWCPSTVVTRAGGVVVKWHQTLKVQKENKLNISKYIHSSCYLNYVNSVLKTSTLRLEENHSAILHLNILFCVVKIKFTYFITQLQLQITHTAPSSGSKIYFLKRKQKESYK